MKIKIRHYITAVILSVGLLGCNLAGSIDDIKLENVLTDEDLITDSRSAETALNGVYSSWRHIDIGWFVNHMSFLTRTVNPIRIVGSNGFATNDVREENEMIGRNYTALYAVINSANSVISILEKNAPKDIEAARLKEMIAEARFHRALAHLMLLRQYGEFYNLASQYGIVTYDFPVRDTEPKGRSTVQETFNFITDDLKFAAENASIDFREHYYVTQLTAKAMLSRVLLYRKQFQEASAVADEVINNAPNMGYSLEPNYLNIFSKRFMSQEALFVPFAEYPYNSSYMYANAVSTGASVQKVADELVAGTKNMNTGAGLDYRFALAFARNNLSKNGNLSTGTNKYPVQVYEQGAHTNTYFFMRLAEVYLIKAEADVRLKHFDDARAALEVITERAGYESGYTDGIADADLLPMIFKHKWMELAYENNEEWFDMVRLHTLDGMSVAPSFVANDKHLCLPIPRTALAGNNKLVQNPAYLQ